VDVADAASIRRANLRAYMERACEFASILVVGEAAGPWGCRFSGMPFTGERQLLDPSFPYWGGQQSSRPDPRLPTRDHRPPFTSDSAETFWGVLLPHHRRFVAWDAVPLHPHPPGCVLRVRTDLRRWEVSQFADALRLVKEYVAPTLSIAVGRVAERALKGLGEHATYVRHPARHGEEAFAAGMTRVFGDCAESSSPYDR
jgi:hypothetical protein